MNKKIIGGILLALIIISIGLYFYLQKENKFRWESESKLTAVTKTSPLPTSSQLEKAILQTNYQISNQELVLTFKITANKPVAFDGADLTFSYPENTLTALKIETGKALDVCPKRAISLGKIEISCINKLENDQSGNINQDLATVYFAINKFTAWQFVIDNTHTKIYFAGQQVPLIIEPRELLIK